MLRSNGFAQSSDVSMDVERGDPAGHEAPTSSSPTGADRKSAASSIYVAAISSIYAAGNDDTAKVKENSATKPTNIAKMCFCFFGLQISYVLWGAFQEQLMTKEYALGKFKSSTFCVFGNRFLALFISFAVVITRRLLAKKDSVQREAPFIQYFPSSISNSLSSWAQYEALKFISFPTQVLSKSCKIIPVMVLGMLVNKKTYGLSECLDALLITAGVAMFTFSERQQGKTHHYSLQQQSDSLYGMSLLCVYLMCDSFTSQWQSRVYKKHGVDQFQMMLGVNIWSLLLTGISLFLLTGDGMESLRFLVADTSALVDTVVLSVTSAAGQLFIFYTVKEFGPVVFTIMMTTRQIVSLFLSCLLFSHPMQLLGWMGAILVFLVVFNRIRRGERD